MFLLAAVLWFAEPAPLDMPRAEAYLVSESGGLRRLEDRFDELDLWTSHAVLGRWKDRDGRLLTISRLDVSPPVFAGDTLTREKEARNREPIPLKDEGDDQRLGAIALLAPFALPEEYESPRQPIRGMKSVRHYRGTNDTAVVCAFLPERHPAWYLAVWELVDGDDIVVAQSAFEDEFLGDWDERVREGLRSEIGIADAPRPKRPSKNREVPCERELLRLDAANSVTNYPSWHVTAAPEFIVLDDLPRDNDFVRQLTNELTIMRARYAETIPSPISVSNVLAVARIFKDRDEYLGALEDNEIAGMEWSGAYWSPRRRELVAYLPPDGARELLKTFRHEAFHQYLSYACSMAAAAPWINEGYAQYFEDETLLDWGMEVDLDQLAEFLPAVLGMDYEQFYDGSDLMRRLKYRMAWSVACFLEKGAPNVRFQPFKDVKRNYVEALLRHPDNRRLATAEAFGDKETLDKFVVEWKKFWKEL